MRGISGSAWLMGLLFLLPGCGTISYVQGDRGEGIGGYVEQRLEGSGIYGGVKLDAHYLRYGTGENGVVNTSCIMFPVLLLDLPLSFVCDTVLLPYTVSKTLTETKKDQTCNGPAGGNGTGEIPCEKRQSRGR